MSPKSPIIFSSGNIGNKNFIQNIKHITDDVEQAICIP